MTDRVFALIAVGVVADTFRITPVAVLEPDDYRRPQEARAYVVHVSPHNQPVDPADDGSHLPHVADLG